MYMLLQDKNVSLQTVSCLQSCVLYHFAQEKVYFARGCPVLTGRRQKLVLMKLTDVEDHWCVDSTSKTSIFLPIYTQ